MAIVTAYDDSDMISFHIGVRDRQCRITYPLDEEPKSYQKHIFSYASLLSDDIVLPYREPEKERILANIKCDTKARLFLPVVPTKSKTKSWIHESSSVVVE